MELTIIEKSTQYNNIINEFIDNYAVSGEPIEVSFRKLVTEVKTDRATHLIHSYPAKLLMNIPYFFLNNTVLSNIGDNVLDPFCGTGTVLLESVLAKRNAYGADANPLARLITNVKTTNYSIKKLEFYFEFIKEKIVKEEIGSYPDVINIDYWFLPNVKEQLNQILYSIKLIDNPKCLDFFMICFSNCVKKVSLADNRVSVPVRLRYDQYPIGHPLREKNKEKLKSLKTIDVLAKFNTIVRDNINRFKKEETNFSSKYKANIISTNAKRLVKPNKDLLKGIKSESIDLIITSPPYAGAQKYIRSSSLNLGWTELAKKDELKQLDSLSIGRENYLKKEYNELLKTGVEEADLLLNEIYTSNALRAHIAANYLIEMRTALNESFKALKKGGYFVLVIANNQVCKREFRTKDYLVQIAVELGLKIKFQLIDDIKSYGLMTKRNKTANIITREWVILFEK
ncbi:DNA methyltransferase [Psychroserpens sp.]|uniref:DNA methyltransferase n=1 Tax=Psychroserpens sp. TaxID=2020870 RepID=UPI002B26E417|nr:DNA methyltransferase [Psychroserpens sp.]